MVEVLHNQSIIAAGFNGLFFPWKCYNSKLNHELYIHVTQKCTPESIISQSIFYWGVNNQPKYTFKKNLNLKLISEGHISLIIASRAHENEIHDDVFVKLK